MRRISIIGMPGMGDGFDPMELLAGMMPNVEMGRQVEMVSPEIIETMRDSMAADEADYRRKMQAIKARLESAPRKPRLGVIDMHGADFEDEDFREQPKPEYGKSRNEKRNHGWMNLKDGDIPPSDEDFDVNVIGLRADGLTQNVWFSYDRGVFYDRHGKELPDMTYWLALPTFPDGFLPTRSEKSDKDKKK